MARRPPSCDSCGKDRKTRFTTTATGRTLCTACADDLDGLTAGAMAGDGDVGTAVAVQAWYRWLRSRRSGHGTKA